MVAVVDVKVLDGFEVEITFRDGTRKILDLEPYLSGPIFEPCRRDPEFFRSVKVDPEACTIVWPNGADICPDVLYHGRKPAFMDPDGP